MKSEYTVYRNKLQVPWSSCFSHRSSYKAEANLER